MPASSFIDTNTNIFIYQLDAGDGRKQAIADGIDRDALPGQDVCISYQVAQECLNVMRTKAKRPLSLEQAGAYLDAVLSPLVQVGASTELFRRALHLRARWQYGCCDSLIIATALAAGCTRLLSEDLQHGQCIEALTIIDPFRI